MAEDKGFKPSHKKLKRAREEGEMIRSPHISQSFGILTSAIVIPWWLRSVWLDNQMLLNFMYISAGQNPLAALRLAAPIVVESVAVGILPGALVSTAVEVLLVRWHLNFALALPRIERLNPLAGAKSLIRGIAKIWLVLIKISLLSISLWTIILGSLRARGDELFWGTGVSIGGEAQAGLILTAAGVFLAFGLFEYLLNYRKFMRDQSMSHDELRREQREDDGDPHLRAARRAMQLELLQDLSHQVRRSKVVIVEQEE